MIYRCKTKQPDGGFVDGCGYQGPVFEYCRVSGGSLRREELRCPRCGSAHLRAVDVPAAEERAALRGSLDLANRLLYRMGAKVNHR